MHWRITAIVLVMGWVGLCEASPRFKVAATIFPLYDLVSQVAGPEVEVVLLVKPGASPHTMAVVPSTIRSLAGSVATFAIGYGLDDWAVRLAADIGVPRTVFVHADIALRSADAAHQHHGAEVASHRAVDPHYWLTVPNAMQIVRTITSTLVALDPDGQIGYERRSNAYQQLLQATDAAIRAQFEGVTRRDIALFHSAFDYYAAAYGLHIIATFAPAPGQEPGPQHVQHFFDQVREHQLRVVFVEPQLPDTAIQSMARDMQIPLSELDPLGGTNQRDSYIALMHYNTRQLVTALRD